MKGEGSVAKLLWNDKCSPAISGSQHNIIGNIKHAIFLKMPGYELEMA